MERVLPTAGRTLAIALTVVLITPLATTAQEQSPMIPGPSPSYEDLIQRLEAAEQRIGEIELNRLDVDPQEDIPDVGAGEGAEQPYESAAGPLDSPARDLEERIASLEEAIPSPDTPTFEAGGRIHLDYWSFPYASEGIGFFEHPDEEDLNFGDDPEDQIGFRRIRLEMQGQIPDLMLWRMQIDFNEPSNPEYKDVYLGWRLPYNHTFIVGNQKRPIGLDHLNSSRFNVFIERPLAVESFNEDARRIGALMYAHSEDLTYNWRYGVFNLENTAETGQYRGDSLQLGAYGRLASTPWYDEASDGRGYLHLGLAGSVARPDGDDVPGDANDNEARFRTRPSARTVSRLIDTGRIQGAEWFEQIGLEYVLNVGSLHITSEYLTTWVQRDDTTRGTGPNVFFHGGYVQAAYFLTGEYMPWDRESGTLERAIPHENFFLINRCTGGIGGGWGAWQVAARYDYLDLTNEDIRGGTQNNYTLGLNWWWNPYARLQFNAVYGDIYDHRPVGGFTEGDAFIVGTRFAVDF